MTEHNSQNQLLRSLITIAEDLNQTLDQLLELMSAQKEALVTSDISRIEQLTELHSQLSVTYHKQEEKFISTLKDVMHYQKDTQVHLAGLTKAFPEAAKVINSWRKKLLEKARLLQEKQMHIMNLLEFVMNRNSSMMKTIYSFHNRSNTHYSISGHKETTVSGVKVNQKI